MTNYRDASDASLVIAVGRWHDEALAEVYQRHAGAVFALARRVLIERSLAEDVVQEVFLRLWREPDRFDPSRGSLRSWLLAQAHGRAVDMARSESARRRREDNQKVELRKDDDSLEREVMEMAMAEHVREALHALPDRERRPIELAYFGGHAYREVAELLGEAEGTVKSRIRSGMRRLAQQLSAAGVEAR